jgi:hypothetical protein
MIVTIKNMCSVTGLVETYRSKLRNSNWFFELLLLFLKGLFVNAKRLWKLLGTNKFFFTVKVFQKFQNLNFKIFGRTTYKNSSNHLFSSFL